MTTQIGNETVNLTYRGISYDYNAPDIESGDTLATGKYRGNDVQFRNSKNVLVMTDQGATAEELSEEMATTTDKDIAAANLELMWGTRSMREFPF